MLQFEWAPTDFFSFDSSTDEPRKDRRITDGYAAVTLHRMNFYWIPILAETAKKQHAEVYKNHLFSLSLMQCEASVEQLENKRSY